jgi:Na+/melibiose symporter-like transporter
MATPSLEGVVTVEKLPKSLLYTYGIADLFFVLMVNMEVYFFPAFLTDYAQFSLAVVANILWLTSAVDIVCALAAGILLQNITLGFGGKYRSWFLVGPPMVVVFYILQFTKMGSDWTAALIIMSGFIMSHLLWNIVVTAGGSMVGRLSPLSHERTLLSASRAQGMSASGLLFSATALPMILFFGASTNEIAGFTITVAVYGVLMILGYWYIYKLTEGRDSYEETTTDSSGKEVRHSVEEMVTLAIKNPPLLLLIATEAFRSSYVLIVSAFAFYYFAYVLDNLAFLSMFILAISIARLIGTFFAAWIGVKTGKRNAYWLFLALAAAGFASAKFFGGTAWSFTAIMCVASLFSAISGSMSTALFSDTVVYGEWKTGKNIRAFTMALQSFPIKVGILFRSAIVALGLMAIGFIANTDPGPRVIEGIRSIMAFTPAAACAAAAVIFYFGYSIDEKHVLQMQKEIAARNNAELANA